MPSPAFNEALGWFHAKLSELKLKGPVGLYGKWRKGWEVDFNPADKGTRELDALLSLYADSSLEGRIRIKHLGYYMEVTTEEIKAARDRMTASGYLDVTVLSDAHQRYIIARKAGR